MVRRALVPLVSGIVLAVSIFAMPASALAASWAPFYGPILSCTGYFQIQQDVKTPDPNDPKNVTVSTFKYQAVDADATGGLPPCRSICDIFVLINNLLKFAVTLIITIFIPAMFILGGFYMMTGGGNPGRRATGQKIITGTLIGLALTIGATLIVNQMMGILFERAWGDAIHQALVDQAAQTGADPASIPSFQWDTISCRAMEGGVEIKTSTSTANPLIPTAPPKQTPPSGGTGGVVLGNNCYPPNFRQTHTCALGWVPNASLCTVQNNAIPDLCKGVLPPGQCTMDANKSLFACDKQWVHATCGGDANGWKCQ